MKKRILIFAILCLLLFMYGVFENQRLTVSHYMVQSRLKNIRIAHVSDLHNASFGKQNATLVQAIQEVKPDLIFLTGDMFDGRRPNLQNSVDFVKQIAGIAPIYYVSGNHEAYRQDLLLEFMVELEHLNVNIADGKSLTIQMKGQEFLIHGVPDPLYYGLRQTRQAQEQTMQSNLERLAWDRSKPQLLLSHRPEYFLLYAQKQVDHVFSGHAHGGQFRLWRSIYAPGQGFFPPYTEGVHSLDASQIIVSRGLGNSIIPIRLNNPPELVIVDLQ